MRPVPRLCLLLILAGCAADSGAKHGGSARMVQPSELSEEKRAVLEAWRAGDGAWEKAQDRAEKDPELARFLVDNLVVQMVRSFDRSAIGSAFQPDSPFARAQAELIRIPASSVPVLAELLLVGDDIVAFLAADTLKRIGAPAVDPVASKLGAERPELRRRVVELLESLPESPSDERAILGKLARMVEHDGAWIVRAQAARSLGTRAGRSREKGDAAAVLTRALSDPDPEIRKTALQALSSLGDASAIPALIRHLESAAHDGDLAGVRASQTALRTLTGETRDLDPEAWRRLWATRAASKPGDPR
jgi:HEAT repeat protein